jgi:hypothetical protein
VGGDEARLLLLLLVRGVVGRHFSDFKGGLTWGV